MKTKLTILEASRATTPEGYIDAIIQAGTYDPDGIHHHITPATLAEIRERFGVTPKPMPSLGRSLLNAGAAAARVAGAIAAGESPFVPSEESERRESICIACTEYFDPKNQRCTLCSCKVVGAIVRKTKLKTEACPARKW